MLNILSLNDLKRTGLKAIKKMFNNEPDIIIQERGKDACILVDLDYYSYLKSCELEVSLIKARKAIEEGNTISLKQHIEEIANV